LNLSISGGFNGDLFGYLTHDSGFAVLLNRVGRTSGNTFGYTNSGLTLTLDDSAATDVHVNGGATTGTFQPDGRDNNPATTLDTTPRTALLSSFNGLDANGSWTLFLADVSPAGGSQFSTLNDWTLVMVGTVPEPAVWALMSAGAAGMLLLLRRQKR
jgi:hypothetical protein